MSTHDPISDLITRIRNAQMRAKPKVSTPGSKMRANVLEVLKTEGYIRGYASVEHASGRSELEIELKYFDGEPVIREIERVSKPGRRVYASVKNLPRVKNGLGISVLSTPKGIMADHAARDANVGGEILFTVFVGRISHVTYRQAACDGSIGGYRDRRGTDRENEGSKGPASVRRAWRRRGEVRKRRGQGRAAGQDQPRAGDVWHGARAGCQPGGWRDQGFREKARNHRRLLTPRAAGQEPAARPRLQPRCRLCAPGRHCCHGAEADRDRRQRKRFPARRPGRRGDPQLPSAGAL